MTDQTPSQASNALLTSAQIEWTEDETPRSQVFAEVYFYKDDGQAETDYVFLQHNRLAERLADAASFCIAETGFGTGLNFLKTVELWLQQASENASLHFVSFEKYPLKLSDLCQAHEVFDDLAELTQALQAAYPMLLPGWHDVWLFDKRVRLSLWFGDVLAGLPQCDFEVDAWFLDGFTPSKNPEMWQPALFLQMARLSTIGTTFVTFTAASDVRRGLEKVGFEVKKDSGFGLKREMSFGQYQQARPFHSKAPWFDKAPAVQADCQTAVVIGAGLAGATTAYRLAEQGFDVTVLEAEEAPATQASGNLAGAIHPLVTADWNLRSQFYLRGFEATLAWLTPWFEASELNGELNGLLQLTVTDTMQERLQDALTRVPLPEDFASWLTPEQASEQLGQTTAFPGLMFPQGGWVEPASVVAKCLAHPKITLVTNETVEKVEKNTAKNTSKNTKNSPKNHQAWWILGQKQAYFADIVVLCTGALSELNETFGLPIRPLKGQVSYLGTEAKSLPMTVMHEGYSVTFPNNAAGVNAITGATFEAPDLSPEISQSGHETNLAMLSALPDWQVVPQEVVGGKVGFRPTTPDHLPMIGAVAENDWMQSAYLSQSHTQAVYRYESQRYQSGLFVNNGHGARGLLSAFLAADMLAEMVQGQQTLMPKSLYHAVHPARFRIRIWRSGR